MRNLDEIREKMDVQGSDGGSVGTVDRVERDSIKLTKTDPLGDGYHHWVPADWIESVDGEVVHLSKPAQIARREWLSSAPARDLR